MGAGRFLYGMALGVGLGIIASKLLAARSSGPAEGGPRVARGRQARDPAANGRRKNRVAAR